MYVYYGTNEYNFEVLAYIFLVLAIWMFAVGLIVALWPGLYLKLILIPEFRIMLALHFAAAALFATVWWSLRPSRRDESSAARSDSTAAR